MCPCSDWPPPPTFLSLSSFLHSLPFSLSPLFLSFSLYISEPLRLPVMVIYHMEQGRWHGGGMKFRRWLIRVWIECCWNWFTLCRLLCHFSTDVPSSFHFLASFDTRPVHALKTLGAQYRVGRIYGGSVPTVTVQTSDRYVPLQAVVRIYTLIHMHT